MRERRVLEEIERLNRKYGAQTGASGSEKEVVTAIPTGVLALDYTLGTGGWPRGRIIHLYGAPDIGKSSTLGLSAFKSAQAEGLFCGLIAVEPGFDGDWARKNGVDTDRLIVARPNNGTIAFNILYDWVAGDLVDFIIFDSLGNVTTPSEDQTEGKAQVGGASGLITSGVRRIVMATWKNKKCVIMLNQIRDDMDSRFGGVQPPGGHLIEHAADIWIHLRQTAGTESFRKAKDDKHDIVVGRNLTAHVTRNKMRQGTGHKATFWYNQMDTEEHGPVGIDSTPDIVATAVRLGIIKKSGGWYSYDAFGDSPINGIASVDVFFKEHPEVVQKIRQTVLEKMEAKVTKHEPGLYLVDGDEGDAA